jgi:hypothetical protein
MTMSYDRESLAAELRQRLTRCLELERQFPDGLTNANIRELEAEIRRQLCELDQLRSM